jgi:hypothetical protein
VNSHVVFIGPTSKGDREFGIYFEFVTEKLGILDIFGELSNSKGKSKF